MAVPVGVGVYAWREGTHARFGRLLVIAGVAWFLGSFSTSSNEVLHSIGRIAGWYVEAGLVYLILAFPSGRLTTSFDRAARRRRVRPDHLPLPADRAVH